MGNNIQRAFAFSGYIAVICAATIWPGFAMATDPCDKEDLLAMDFVEICTEATNCQASYMESHGEAYKCKEKEITKICERSSSSWCEISEEELFETVGIARSEAAGKQKESTQEKMKDEAYPKLPIQSNCATNSYRYHCLLEPIEASLDTHISTIMTTNTDITIDGISKNITNGSFSFNWELSATDSGEAPWKASIKNVIITDHDSGEIYDFDNGDLSAFSINDAQACFGYQATTDWDGDVEAQYEGETFARVNSLEGTESSSACGDVIIRQDSGIFRVPYVSSAGTSFFYPLILKGQ